MRVLPSDAYAALRHPFVRSFAIGRFAAIAGWQMINVAVGWLLYERTGDPWSLGLVGVAELTPVLFLMVIAGNAADRYPRRNIGIFAHAVLTCAATGLALLSWSNGPTWQIYSLLVMVGTARAFASPSVNTILPQLLAPAEFANANAWLSSTFQLAAITGPAVGGMLIAGTGSATLAFALAAVGQLVFILMLRTMPVAACRRRHTARSAAPASVRGLQVRARQNPLFLSAITLDLFAVLFGGAVALLPIYAKDILQVGPAGLGWLRAAPGLGALSMALITTRIKPWAHPGRVLLWVRRRLRSRDDRLRPVAIVRAVARLPVPDRRLRQHQRRHSPDARADDHARSPARPRLGDQLRVHRLLERVRRVRERRDRGAVRSDRCRWWRRIRHADGGVDGARGLAAAGAHRTAAHAGPGEPSAVAERKGRDRMMGA